MPARSRLAPLLLIAPSLAGACGGKTDPAVEEDAGVVEFDAMQSSSTLVTGMLEGTPFTLTHAAIGWPEADSRTWVCLSDHPTTYDACLEPQGPSRVVFLGPFVTNQSGQTGWIVGQLGLYRVGGSPLSDFANSGTITVDENSPETMELSIALEVQFADNGEISGTVRVP